jgi:predicted phage terminase large subunit-like protein
LQQPSPAATIEDLAFSSLLAYAHLQWPGYRDGAHHRLIARKLEAVERGEITRLMISMPPRHGKSMLSSEFFPAWYLGRNPNHYVIAATYAQDLADDFGRKVRNQIVDPLYQAVFPGVGLKTDSTSARRFNVSGALDSFTTDQDGAYFAVGVGGPLTGRGAHLLLIDDPVKNREEAESEVIRRKTKDWYTSTAYTRLMPKGRIVIIQTRWHEDDLSGWQLREHQQEGWDVLSLPAIDDAGKALWPEQYPIEALEKIRRNLGPRDWTALYQQSPSPEDGSYFLKEWFHLYDHAPPLETMKVYGASDYAVTDAGGDFTVHIVVGIDPVGQMWLLDLWRKQATSDVWVDAWCELVTRLKPSQWAEESGQINAGVGPFLMRRALETGASTWRRQFPSRHDKAIRARSIQGRLAMRGMMVPRNAPWLADFLSELMAFPNGRNDDQPDALGLIGQLLDLVSAGQEKQEQRQKPKELEYQVTPSGLIQGNASVREAVEAMIRRKRREA